MQTTSQTAANPQGLLPSTTTIVIYYYYSAQKMTRFIIPWKVTGCVDLGRLVWAIMTNITARGEIQSWDT